MANTKPPSKPYFFLVYVETGNFIQSSQDVAELEALAKTIAEATKIVR